MLTKRQLQGPLVRRLFQDVYSPRDLPVTHRLRCEGAALILPPCTVLTGRSAATLAGVNLAGVWDPVEVIAPLDERVTRRAGIDLPRTEIKASDSTPWQSIRLAGAGRMGLDLLLDRTLPDTVADLDQALRTGLVSIEQIEQVLKGRRIRGSVQARRAIELSDPRAESPPESLVRVYLALAGLHPDLQVWIHDRTGPIAQVDLAFEDLKIAIEYDGQWKTDLWALNRDRRRLNAVRAAGWDVVFITAETLRDPAKIVALVRAAIMARTAA